MSRRPAKFTQADVARALRAAKQEGLNMVVEMSPDGTIRLVPMEAGLTIEGSEASLDRELTEHMRTRGHG